VRKYGREMKLSATARSMIEHLRYWRFYKPGEGTTAREFQALCTLEKKGLVKWDRFFSAFCLTDRAYGEVDA
jgi:hypothetical protein